MRGSGITRGALRGFKLRSPSALLFGSWRIRGRLPKDLVCCVLRVVITAPTEERSADQLDLAYGLLHVHGQLARKRVQQNVRVVSQELLIYACRLGHISRTEQH